MKPSPNQTERLNLSTAEPETPASTLRPNIAELIISRRFQIANFYTHYMGILSEPETPRYEIFIEPNMAFHCNSYSCGEVYPKPQPPPPPPCIGLDLAGRDDTPGRPTLQRRFPQDRHHLTTQIRVYCVGFIALRQPPTHTYSTHPERKMYRTLEPGTQRGEGGGQDCGVNGLGLNPHNLQLISLAPLPNPKP